VADSSFADWVGRTETRTQSVDAWPLLGLAALLDRDDAPAAGEAIHPAAHWLYFGPTVPQSEIGEDGHAKRGGFLPPIPQPRRMWAGSSIAYTTPLRVGESVERTSRILSIDEKQGKAGPLIFVQVEHAFRVGGQDRLTDRQTIVYRDPPGPSEAPPPAMPAPEGAVWSKRVDPDPVLLFRYSAVTFNGHRIHYDEPYVTGVEGYPGLIVHGPLTATLLVDLWQTHNPGVPLRSFSFRAVKPLFSGRPFHVEGKPAGEGKVELWTRDADGALCTTAKIEAG
jgi:3-methylfumaryl-CoA hydratase